MLPKKHTKVLKFIAEKLNNTNINWIVVGSTNLAMQGVDIEPNDIDILTDKKGAFEIEKILQDFVTKPVKYSENKKFRSYYGILKIEDIEIEIMGDLVNKKAIGDLWNETRGFVGKIYFNLIGTKIPVNTLEKELSAYKKIGREKKVDKIQAFINHNEK
ncbi:hypothetical protein GF362_03560 [Candidatus Dojkabacteria bacterium]|nr:hypothetical protein [Candidatus Dojkabacteria bacterium]